LGIGEAAGRAAGLPASVVQREQPVEQPRARVRRRALESKLADPGGATKILLEASVVSRRDPAAELGHARGQRERRTGALDRALHRPATRRPASPPTGPPSALAAPAPVP